MLLEDAFKFKLVNVKEWQGLNHLIHIEECITYLNKSLKDHDEISEKEKTIYTKKAQKEEFSMDLPKFIRH